MQPASASATIADEPPRDQLARPELRLIASEPDLAALPRTALPLAPDPAPDARQAPPRETPQRSEEGEAAVLSSLSAVQNRIAALPTAPDIVLPAADKPPPSTQANGLWSLVGRVDQVTGIRLSSDWWRTALAGGLALIAGVLLWRLGRRRRAAAAVNDSAPIQWEPSGESEAALRAMLQAKRADAAKKQAPPQLRHGFATLGEALVAMKTAAARPLPHPAAADPQRTLDA